MCQSYYSTRLFIFSNLYYEFPKLYCFELKLQPANIYIPIWLYICKTFRLRNNDRTIHSKRQALALTNPKKTSNIRSSEQRGFHRWELQCGCVHWHIMQSGLKIGEKILNNVDIILNLLRFHDTIKFLSKKMAEILEIILFLELILLNNNRIVAIISLKWKWNNSASRCGSSPKVFGLTYIFQSFYYVENLWCI